MLKVPNAIKSVVSAVAGGARASITTECWPVAPLIGSARLYRLRRRRPERRRLHTGTYSARERVVGEQSLVSVTCGRRRCLRLRSPQLRISRYCGASETCGLPNRLLHRGLLRLGVKRVLANRTLGRVVDPRATMINTDAVRRQHNVRW